ncbi:hypothetical protein D3C73_1202330 [compost metagenome]
MVDQCCVHFAGVDGFHGGAVALVSLEVFLHALEPFFGCGLTLELKQGRDDRLEVGAGGGSGPLSLPLGLCQIQHGLGQLVIADLVLVVHQDGGARGNTSPFAGGRAELGRNLVDGGFVDVGEQARILHLRHCRGVLGEEDVCR